MPAKTVIQLRRDTSTNWDSVNPILAAGEAGFETDTSKLKIGDGTATWSSLAYFGNLDSLNNVGDVTITSAATGQVLQYDGTKWVNATIDLSTKQDTITGAATTITSSNLTASRAVVSDGSGKVAVSDVTATELGHVSGVTSAIQTQLNGKAASVHTHLLADITDYVAPVIPEVTFTNNFMLMGA